MARPHTMRLPNARTASKRTTVNGEQFRSFNWILPNRLLNSIFSRCSRNSGKPGADRPAMNFSPAERTICEKAEIGDCRPIKFLQLNPAESDADQNILQLLSQLG